MRTSLSGSAGQQGGNDADTVLASLRGQQDFRRVAFKLLTYRSGTVFKSAESTSRWSPPLHSGLFTGFPRWCPKGYGWRVWDEVSRSQLTGSQVFAFQAGDVERPLKSREDRREALQMHADWENRVLMPFVAVTMDEGDALSRARYQSARNRGRVRLSLIDLRERWNVGLPFVQSEMEMKTFEVPDKYARNYQFYKHEALCLWGITHREVVHTWSWEEIQSYTAQQLVAESERWMQRQQESGEAPVMPTSSEVHAWEADDVQPAPVEPADDAEAKVEIEEVSALASMLSISASDHLTPRSPEASTALRLSTSATTRTIAVSSDNRWMIVPWENKVAVITNPVLDDLEQFSVSRVRLSLTCLPKKLRQTFDTAEFVSCGSSLTVLVTSGQYVVWWDLSDLPGEDEMCPMFVERCKDAESAQRSVRLILKRS